METINIITGGCMVKTRIYTYIYIFQKVKFSKKAKGCTPVTKTSAGL